MTLITDEKDARLAGIEVRCNVDTETKAREDRAILFDSLRALIAERDALLEQIKCIEEETTCCVYCGERMSWKEPVENITKHVENCDKHPLKYWIGRAEEYKAERDALQVQLCKAREIVTLACERLEKLSNQKEIIYGTYLSAIRDILYPESQLFAGEHRPELFCRHAEDSKRLNQSMDTIHAVSENRRKMFEDAHNALTRIYEKLDREKVRVVIKHDAWAITSHDDPFILYQQGNMSKGKLCEYIAKAVCAYLKEGK